jgi:probable HAF family extracellular repeat protein
MQSRLVVCSLVLLVQIVIVLHVGAAQAEAPAGYTVTAIQILDGFNDVQANMINSKSTAVGVASGYDSAGNSAFYPILYQNGKLKFLGGDGVIGSASDVNNRGKIVGYVSPDGISGGTVPALLATDGYTDLGNLGGDGGANAINGNSQVVGYSYTGEGSDSPAHAFYWEEGDITDLGGLADDGSSYALDINDDGLIVGASTQDAATPIFSPGTHAVIW